jgi:hypothetical protein
LLGFAGAEEESARSGFESLLFAKMKIPVTTTTAMPTTSATIFGEAPDLVGLVPPVEFAYE